jgi:hypothetical protein
MGLQQKKCHDRSTQNAFQQHRRRLTHFYTLK